MLAEGRLPRDDAWSFTRLGTPWVDFEWAFQLAVYAVHSLGGWPGLWVFKALLWSLCAALVELLGRLSGGAARGRLLVVLWAAMSLGRAELKPELFSAIFFLAGLWWLEARRRGVAPAVSIRSAALCGAGYFALWVNLHPGFAGGLGLLALYAICAGEVDRPALRAALAAGAAATLLNPYGWGVWAVLADHALRSGMLSRLILEWSPLTFQQPMHLPQLVVLAAMAAAVAAAIATRRSWPSPLEASAVIVGLAALRQARHMTYGSPLAGLVLLESAAALAERWNVTELRRRVAAAGFALTAAAFLVWQGGKLCLPLRACDMTLFPVGAVDFVTAEAAEFSHRRPFNEWGWGGYLAWRLGSETRVFMDGRYIFHSLLEDVFNAATDGPVWRALLDHWGVEWALVSDHSRGGFNSVEWVLVYRDRTARVYVRRGGFPADWVKAREIRVPQGSL